jgi:hypothetical protein
MSEPSADSPRKELSSAALRYASARLASIGQSRDDEDKAEDLHEMVLEALEDLCITALRFAEQMVQP